MDGALATSPEGDDQQRFLAVKEEAKGRRDGGVQGQIVLGAQGLVGAMEDACHPEGVEKEEE
ncbi:MAG: hypothetical protein OXFUSZZB_000166 [Candidatus Fervidibacter sp.]|jgi:hypothetical protein